MHYYDPFTGFVLQRTGTCCFIYAVANSIIAKGGFVSAEELECLMDIGSCRTGSVIGTGKVVTASKAQLVETVEISDIFECGGVLNIWHPIFNGHSFYLDKEEDGEHYRCVNSWLGPGVMTGIGRSEIEPFVTDRCGSYWKCT